MKKVLFASAAALCAVVGLSSFKADKLVNFRYFTVTSTIPYSATPSLQDADVQYLQQTNPGDICSGTANLCIVQVNTANLTSGKQHLKAGSQPAVVISTQN